MDRRLAAILATDVVGYSRLIRADDEGTISALNSLRTKLVYPTIAAHHGRIVKLMGDGMLAEFPSVVEAVRAAVETQQALADHNSGLPVEKRIEFRVGINLGDVLIDGDDILGDGVNVASRLEGISHPGGICVSGKVYEEVRDRTALAFEDMGEQKVKNIDRPVRVWRWVPHGRALAADGPPKSPKSAPPDNASIVDLPFDNMGHDPGQEILGDGATGNAVTDDIGQTETEASGSIFVTVLGGFRISGPEGLELTPRSMKACGVIALLLDAPNLTCARISLQNKLWSDRQPRQSAASLRRTLSDIRKALGPCRDILGADRRSVWLNPKRTTSDWQDASARARAAQSGLEFLEDLDVRDPEFEKWVSERRAELPPEGTRVRDDEELHARPMLELASTSTGGDVYGKYILQSIANGVSEFGSVDIVWADLPEVKVSDRALRLEFAESEVGDYVVARLQLVAGSQHSISWQITSNLLRAEAPATSLQISRMLSEGTDRTIDALSRWQHPGPRGRYTSLYFKPIQDMLKTKGSDYTLLRKNFQECFELEPRGIYLAWQAFLACFILGERRATGPSELKVEARALIRRALELEPHNSLILALASNVYGLVLNEIEVGHELAERSVRLNPNSTLGWTFLGNAKLYRNESEEAYQILLRAREISGEGPYRHLVDCVTCIAAILSGRVDEGIAIGETVNAITPDFRPALRYLLAAYISKNDLDGARGAFERLRKIEPNFELSLFADPDYPVPALRASGMLDLNHLPNLF